MPQTTPFRRILVKLSGEALAAPDGYWLHPPTLAALAEDIARTIEAGAEVAIVVVSAAVTPGPGDLPEGAAFLGKPFTPSRLNAAVERARATKRPG